MNDLFWLIFLVPVLWPLAARVIFKTEITWAEMALNIGIVCVLMSGVWYAGNYSATSDTEIWSGTVKNKAKVRVSCEHSYSCNCTTSTNKDGSTTETCDTCYDHSYDVDWRVKTNIGDFNIRRTDRRGLNTPPRWTQVQVGEPASLEKGYTNYVQAVAESLFNEDKQYAERYAKQIPNYPSVYDYYRIDRVIDVDVGVKDLKQWNADLSGIMRELGPKKQANINIVFVNNPDSKYIYGLRSAWEGFEKNDIVIAVGSTNYPKIDWVQVQSWSKNKLFNVTARDELTDLGTINREQFIATIDHITKEHFVRRPMAEFEYLKDEIEPPMWAMIIAMLIAFVGSPALTWWFHQVDIRFPFEQRKRKW